MSLIGLMSLDANLSELATSMTTTQARGRRIIVCCDGTSNQFSDHNTNVVRLVQVLNRDAARQIVYYDPGVGTLPEPSLFFRVGQTLSRWGSLAFGTGVIRNVEEAYSYLMEAWEPGDEVFLFGFSRGAYTVRVLAGMLHQMGLLPRGNANLVPYVMRLFGAIRDQGPWDKEGSNRYWRLCNRFRTTFAREVEGVRSRRFPVRFIGVWDTVSSVGWVYDPAKYPFTAKNPSVRTVRHAVAIDERRWFFRQNLFIPLPGQDVQEKWFAGVHADIGGGYPAEESGLWKVAFEWMIVEAHRAGLEFDCDRIEHVFGKPPRKAADLEPKHESLTGKWWPLEFVPKLRHSKEYEHPQPQVGRGKSRDIPDTAVLHPSVITRLKADSTYRPPNLSAALIAKAQLDEIRSDLAAICPEAATSIPMNPRTAP